MISKHHVFSREYQEIHRVPFDRPIYLSIHLDKDLCKDV